mmetsp:Transcript_18486/g.25705  ORF Transcript_18486/g.25705 Transcript_18486/m.25705 type:complete len:161 (+) Transcript_18486:458-940(+)
MLPLSPIVSRSAGMETPLKVPQTQAITGKSNATPIVGIGSATLRSSSCIRTQEGASSLRRKPLLRIKTAADVRSLGSLKCLVSRIVPIKSPVTSIGKQPTVFSSQSGAHNRRCTKKKHSRNGGDGGNAVMCWSITQGRMDRPYEKVALWRRHRIAWKLPQ